ncbi:hypothetical protein BDP27DRAFT_530151 [Rhodocollybia butyracea]|uniref:Uncharacterized protein n=1 Tax=Rhodocollybia butyracea TaxID=206335 RepID=A0A9P5TY51_9AGAR|nr:hypothetical protein BDP27DRAFT_530151 [Rhodocollybia butyracea]
MFTVQDATSDTTPSVTTTSDDTTSSAIISSDDTTSFTTTTSDETKLPSTTNTATEAAQSSSISLSPSLSPSATLVSPGSSQGISTTLPSLASSSLGSAILPSSRTSTPSARSSSLTSSSPAHSLSTTDYILIGVCIGMALILLGLYIYHHFRRKPRKSTGQTASTPYTFTSQVRYLDNSISGLTTTDPSSHFRPLKTDPDTAGLPPITFNENAREMRIAYESAPPSYAEEE